jgi:hypothetical protein
MTRHVLVVLRRGDDLDDVLPYVEEIARPGLTITFLIDHSLSGLTEVLNQAFKPYPVIVEQQLSRTGPDVESPMGTTNGDQQSGTATRQEPRKQGVEIKVKVYTGNLKRILREFMEKECVQTIVMRQHRDHFWRQLLSLGMTSGPMVIVPATPLLLYRRITPARGSDARQYDEIVFTGLARS